MQFHQQPRHRIAQHQADAVQIADRCEQREAESGTGRWLLLSSRTKRFSTCACDSGEMPGPRSVPGWLGGFGAGANYTYVDSSAELRPGDKELLPSTSQHTANLARLKFTEGPSNARPIQREFYDQSYSLGFRVKL